MILSLHIENIAVIKSLDIDFCGGFTVLSGETGAGKSIIIDSLGLLSGARADKELIRSGESYCEVSALFSNINEGARMLISELGFSLEDETLMLSRRVSRDGPSGARLNGRVIPLSLLRELSSALFNIHGQSDNHRLLDKANHLSILDRFADIEGDVEDYGNKYKEILHLRNEIDSFERDVMENNRLREMLRYQIDDINALKLKVGEEEALSAESKRLQSIERIKKSCMLADRALSGGEKGAGAIYLVERAAAALSQLSDALPETEELSERLSDIRYELEDISSSALRLLDDCDGDPTEKIDKIEGRLDAISKLKRKYGSTVEEILAYRDNAEKRLDTIENSNEIREELEKRLDRLSNEAKALAEGLSTKRKTAASELKKRVTETLEFLDMPKVRFGISIVPTSDFTPTGLDSAEFLISANAGEEMMPMIKIASGGELARIMLSLKSVLNECDGIDTAIFDEIDTGISGKTSRKVGIKLRRIADSTQVLCVTHSAQIASLGNEHMFISKEEVNGRVQTAVRTLDDDGRVEEIARILGGIKISDLQRSAAREMIEEGKKL